MTEPTSKEGLMWKRPRDFAHVRHALKVIARDPDPERRGLKMSPGILSNMLKEIDTLQARVAELEAAALTRRPIETAPKDGRPVLLERVDQYADFQITIGYWSDRFQDWNSFPDPGVLEKPTHWMPLPPQVEAEPTTIPHPPYEHPGDEA